MRRQYHASAIRSQSFLGCFRCRESAYTMMQTPMLWGEKPYYSLDYYCKQTYGEKVYKITLDSNMTCPNRDGTLGTRGCIFCSAGGSGDFAVKRSSALSDVKKQLAFGKAQLQTKRNISQYIAYFQSFTNTYAPVSYLEELYTQALSDLDVIGISIATRPDCLPPDVLSLLASLKHRFPSKFIWVELGLQTIHPKTASYIRRGYPLICFEKAVIDLHALDIPVITHLILGLPQETETDMLASAAYLNALPVWGVKLQLLHVLKGTDLYTDYQQNLFSVLSFEEYIAIIVSCLEILSPNIVIHRMTGDGPKDLLAAPLWSQSKRSVLNAIHKTLKEKQVWQGKKYYDTGLIDTL